MVLPSIAAPAPVLSVLEACLNVKGCNAVEKRDEIGSMFEEWRLDILSLSETKLTGEEELSFGGVRGFKSEVGRKGNMREGVAILLNECVWICVKEIRRINSGIMYVGICIKKEFWTVIVVYDPGMERSEEERGGFSEEMKGCIEVCEDRWKVVIIWKHECQSG